MSFSEDNPGRQRANGGGTPYLSYALHSRFPVKDAEPDRTDNFFVHHVADTGGHRYIVLQSLPRLQRQTHLVDTIKANLALLSTARDGRLHERLEVVEPPVPEEPFYLVESIDGDPLGTLVAGEDLKQEKAMEIVRSLLKALEPIHERGLVYGSMDLDQIHVVRSEVGTDIKLGGLYRVFKPENPVHLGFNPEFNAPPAPSERPLWTPEDDIYVVGMIAYRLLLGRDAYQQALAAPLNASPENRSGAWENQHKSSGAFPRPADAVPGLSRHIESWIIQARNSAREARFRNAHVAAEALAKAIDDARKDPGGGWGTGQRVVIAPPKRTARISPLLLTAFSVMMVICIGAGGFLLWNRPGADQLAALQSANARIAGQINDHADAMGKLASDNPIALGFVEGRRQLRAAIASYPPSRLDYPALQQAFENAGKTVDQAVGRLDDLARQARDEQSTSNAAIARLAAVAPADDPALAAARERLATLDGQIAAGAFDQALAAAAGLAADAGNRAVALDETRTAAEARLKQIETRAAALRMKGADKLDRSDPLAKDYAEWRALAATAAAAFEARQWSESLAAGDKAVAAVDGLSGKLVDNADAVTALLAATGRQLADLGALAPSGDPVLADASGKVEAATGLVATKSWALARAVMTAAGSELGTAIALRRDQQQRAAAAIASIQAQSKQLAALSPADSVDEAAAREAAANAEAAFEARQFEQASSLAGIAEVDLAGRIDAASKARAGAVAARDAYRGSLADRRLVLAGGFGDEHPLKRRIAPLNETGAAGEKALQERRWDDATTSFGSGRQLAGGIAAGVDALAAKVASDGEALKSKIAEIAGLAGERAAELMPLRAGLGAAQKAAQDEQLDDAASVLEAALRNADLLLAALPAEKAARDKARDDLSRMMLSVEKVALRLGGEQPLRRAYEALATRRGAIEEKGETLTLKVEAESYGVLVPEAEKLADDVAMLVKESEKARGGLASAISAAEPIMPRDDAALASARNAESDAADLAGRNEFDAAIKVAATASAALAEATGKTAALAADARARRGALVASGDALVKTYGDWILALPAHQPVADRLGKLDAALAARSYAEALSEAAEGHKALGAWQAAVGDAGGTTDAAKVAFEQERSKLAEMGAEDTDGFRRATALADGAARSAAAHRFAEAVAAYGEAGKALAAARSEHAANAAEVAELREETAAEATAAPKLLPEGDPVLAELAAVGALAPSPKADGTTSRLAAFRSAEGKAKTALATAAAARTAVRQRIDALAPRIEAAEAAGGRDSADFANMAAAMSQANAAWQARNYAATGEAVGRAEILLAKVETVIKGGGILNCPDTDKEAGTRLIKPGSYVVKANSYAGRIAGNARPESFANGAASFDVKLDKPFCIFLKPVTGKDFEDFVSETHRDTKVRTVLMGGGDAAPSAIVEFVARDDAQAFIDWLSKKTGRNYRLPSLDQVLAAAVAAGSAPDDASFTKLPDQLADRNREWTSEKCREGANGIVIGRIGLADDLVYAQCLPDSTRSPGLGFRLVMVAAPKP